LNLTLVDRLIKLTLPVPNGNSACSVLKENTARLVVQTIDFAATDSVVTCWAHVNDKHVSAIESSPRQFKTPASTRPCQTERLTSTVPDLSAVDQKPLMVAAVSLHLTVFHGTMLIIMTAAQMVLFVQLELAKNVYNFL